MITAQPAIGRHLWGFIAWAAVGAGVSIAALTPFTIGLAVACIAVVGGVVLLAGRVTHNAAIAGLLAGPGVIALWIGYLNRDGPGTVCRTSASGHHCTDEWSPWPWLAVGILFLAASVVLFLAFRRGRQLSR